MTPALSLRVAEAVTAAYVRDIAAAAHPALGPTVQRPRRELRPKRHGRGRARGAHSRHGAPLAA